jgi:hypothetical protein
VVASRFGGSGLRVRPPSLDRVDPKDADQTAVAVRPRAEPHRRGWNHDR